MRFTPGDYAELLAHYLGDGTISSGARSFRLRIALDAKYPGIIDDARALLERCFPRNPTGLVQAHGGTMYFVSLYSTHLPCLFPQHGPGLKHLRKLRFETWQWSQIESAPWRFIRGCIRTDGCCFVNRTGPYEYLSYDFSNMSEEITRLFTAACDLVGVEYRVANGNARGMWDVRINRRASVAANAGARGAKDVRTRYFELPPAAVAELVYAHGSGPCGRKPVEVRILSAALFRPRIAGYPLLRSRLARRYRLGD